MSLQDWLKNSWLVEHKTSQQEIVDLLGVADRDLTDCKSDGLSADWQMNIAYNAALQAASNSSLMKPVSLLNPLFQAFSWPGIRDER